MKSYYMLSGADSKESFLTSKMQDMIKNDLLKSKNLVAIATSNDFENNDKYFYGDDNIFGVVRSFAFANLEKFNLVDERVDKNEAAQLINEADILYLSGGDPFEQMRIIRKLSLIEMIRDFEGVVVGLSAGSMNMAVKTFFNKDKNLEESIIYEGIGLVDITIDPHFDINCEESVSEIVKFSKELPIIGLPDYSMIRVVDNSVETIGEIYKYGF